MPLALHQTRESETTEQLGKCSVARFDWSNDMEKLERVQRMTYRRMGQVDSELERFEERPELDSRGRYGSLLKRLEELEKLYYNLRRKEAPSPYRLVERILAEQSTRMIMQTDAVNRGGASTPRVTSRELGNREDPCIFPLYGA
jgi:hypothetical protein